MKKKLIYFCLSLLVILLFFKNCGIQIGNVRIGKQNDFTTKQDLVFENSSFYKKFYSKDDLIVLNLWATWCKPCIEEMPMLNKLKDKYKNTNVKFVSFSIDTDSVKLNNFLSSNKFKFTDLTFDNLKFKTTILNTLDNKKPDNWISSYSVPLTYVIKNQKVIKKTDGIIEETELDSLILMYK